MNIPQIIFVGLLATTSVSVIGMEPDLESNKQIVKNVPSLKFIATNCVFKEFDECNHISSNFGKLPLDMKEFCEKLAQVIFRYKIFAHSEDLQKNPTQALFNAIEAGATTIIPDLITLGANINGVWKTSLDSITPLIFAAGPFFCESINASSQLIFKPHTLKNNIELIDLLISLGAKIDTLSSRLQWNALHYAVWSENFPSVMALVNHGASVNAKIGDEQKTILHHIISNTNNLVFCTKLIQFLIKNKADINLQDFKGSTPLHYGVIYKKIDLIRLLLQYKPDITIINQNGLTPLQMAQERGWHEAIELLKKYQKAKK